MGKHVEYTPEWVREDFIDFLAEKVNPLWAWKKAKARIVAKHHLSDDSCTCSYSQIIILKQPTIKLGKVS